MRGLVVFTACFLLLAAIPSPARSAADDPLRRGIAEQRKAEAASLLQKGDVTGAYTLYRLLAREYPEDDLALLGLARAAVAAKRWNQAVPAYEMLLARHPGDAWLYGELADTYMLIGDRTAAERSLVMRESLGGGGEGGIPGLLEDLEKRYGQVQIHGKVRAGVLYDSNVNMGPDAKTLDLGSWRLRVPDAERRESFGAYLGADLDLGWRPLRDSGWWIVGDVKAFWRGYEDSSLHDTLHARESQWARGAVGARYVGVKTLVDLRLKAEIFDFDLYQHVSAVGPEITFLYALTPSVQLVTSGGWDYRSYSQSEERKGGYGYAGEYLRLFFGQDNHEFLLGGRFLWGYADFADYSYEGWEGSARFLFKLPRGFEFAPFVSVTQEFYHGPATALETKNRYDTRLRLGAALTWRLTEQWALEASYQYTANASECSLYTYRQHLVTTGIAWSF